MKKAPRGAFAVFDFEMTLPSPPEGHGLSWAGAVAVVLAALPWLLPGQGPPWNSFYREAFAGLVWLPLAAWLLWTQRRRLVLPWPAIVLLAMAVVPFAQAGLGVVEGASQAAVPALYLAGLALAIVAGRNAAGRPWFALPLASLALAGLASTALALAQWLQIDMGIWVPALAPGQRPMANLGQPNHLATLLLWAMVALWWAWLARAIGSAVASVAAVWLLAGLVLTQSRTGLLGLALLAAVALVRPGSGTRWPARWWVAAVAVLAAGLWLGVRVAASQADLVQGARSGTETLSAGKRPAIWLLALDAIGRSPWCGYGWGLGGRAHWAVMTDHAPLHVFVTYAHNLLLDLAVWTGIPLALALAVSAAIWVVQRVRRAQDTASWLLLAALGVFAVHAMLEMPHAYAYFLASAGLMIGAIDAHVALSMSAPRRRRTAAVVGALWVAVAASVVVLVTDYRAVQADFTAYRFRAARIGDLAVTPEPKPWLLADLQRSLAGLRIVPRRGMPAEEIDALMRAVARHPGRTSLMRLAQAQWLNGRPDAAADALRRLCALNPPAACEEALAAWQAWVARADEPHVDEKNPGR